MSTINGIPKPVSAEFTMDAAGLEGLMRDAMEYVSGALSDPSPDFAQCVLVRGKRFTDRVLRTMTAVLLHEPFDEADEKNRAMRNVGRQVYREQLMPMAAVLCSDAWVAPDRPGMQPRDCSDRREAIVVAGQTIGGKHQAITRMFYTRTADGMIVAGKFEAISTTAQAFLVEQVWHGFLASFNT